MTVSLHLGDCLDVMATLEAESLDAIVTDPPYGLSFMGKNWDHGVPGERFWREALRVAKPGAHLLAFGGTRTYHRLACAIEDAGWEIRDCVMWVYGSGFPKSHDVSKAIDRRGGSVVAFEKFRDAVREAMKQKGVRHVDLQQALGNQMLGHYLANGSQPAIPNLRDYRIIRDTVGLGSHFDELFNDEAEREVVGKQVGSMLAVAPGQQNDRSATMLNITAPATDAAKQWEGWGTALKPAWEPIIVARKPLVGTVAENVLRHGTGAINVDGCRVGTDECRRSASGDIPSGKTGIYRTRERVEQKGTGRWPANVIHDGSDEVVGLFPITSSGEKRPEHNRNVPRLGNVYSGDPGGQVPRVWHADSGSASRFFYCAKASKADRDEWCEEVRNHHPTVKPTELMRYLCRLVTPPNGVILDPFMGSGSTGKGALLEGFRFVGIEREPEYLEIARARLAHVMKSEPPILQMLNERTPQPEPVIHQLCFDV